MSVQQYSVIKEDAIMLSQKTMLPTTMRSSDIFIRVIHMLYALWSYILPSLQSLLFGLRRLKHLTPCPDLSRQLLVLIVAVKVALIAVKLRLVTLTH
jgi:hypothetical protein